MEVMKTGNETLVQRKAAMTSHLLRTEQGQRKPSLVSDNGRLQFRSMQPIVPKSREIGDGI